MLGSKRRSPKRGSWENLGLVRLVAECGASRCRVSSALCNRHRMRGAHSVCNTVPHSECNTCVPHTVCSTQCVPQSVCHTVCATQGVAESAEFCLREVKDLPAQLHIACCYMLLLLLVMVKLLFSLKLLNSDYSSIVPLYSM